MPASPKPAPSRPVPRKIYKYPQRSNAPLMAVGVAILIAIAVVVHHPHPASATRGPVQRLFMPVNVDPVGIVEKLKAGNFAAIETQIKTYQAAANADPRAEMNLVYAFNAFTLPDSAIGDQVKTWTAHAPDSAIAHCARAVVLEQAAARARGHEGGPSSSIQPDAFVEMEKDLSQATMEADSARSLDPELMNAYLTAINAATLESDPVALEDASKRAGQISPELRGPPQLDHRDDAAMGRLLRRHGQIRQRIAGACSAESDAEISARIPRAGAGQGPSAARKMGGDPSAAQSCAGSWRRLPRFLRCAWQITVRTQEVR
jgi:hypothetical protein